MNKRQKKKKYKKDHPNWFWFDLFRKQWEQIVFNHLWGDVEVATKSFNKESRTLDLEIKLPGVVHEINVDLNLGEQNEPKRHSV